MKAQTEQTVNKYLFQYYFNFLSESGLQGWLGFVGFFFGFSEKQRLLSALQNYRVWSSGELSLSSQLSLTLPPPKLLFSNHLLINGVNGMRCQNPPPIFPATKMGGICAAIRRIWSNTQTSEQWLLLVFKKRWVWVCLQRSETSESSTKRFPWINTEDKALLQCFKT